MLTTNRVVRILVAATMVVAIVVGAAEVTALVGSNNSRVVRIFSSRSNSIVIVAVVIAVAFLIATIALVNVSSGINSVVPAWVIQIAEAIALIADKILAIMTVDQPFNAVLVVLISIISSNRRICSGDANNSSTINKILPLPSSNSIDFRKSILRLCAISVVDDVEFSQYE
uniref:Uncharacterized protein n=1 Tax=Glossina pallidipes TaxID=7398 RepID=A0A1A9ZLZ4_GLOPL